MIIGTGIEAAIIHTLDTPVFVIGHARSGTSLMTRILRKYLHINFGSESQFFIRFDRKLNQYGDLEQPKNLRHLIADISRERCFQKWHKKYGFKIDQQSVFNEITEPKYATVISTIFKQFATYQQMSRWGDKTPEYLNDLPVLLHLFPDAQFIHIVRDGRDVALSNFKAPFGSKNIYVAAEQWSRQMELIRSFQAELSDQQLIEIRYEDLMTTPQRVLLQLINFLKVDDEEGHVFQLVVDTIQEELIEHNIGKWKSAISYRDRLLYERVAAPMLKRYGYETWLDIRDYPCWPVRWYWKTHNHVKKRMRLSYWKDNGYKLKLRLRLLFSPLKRLIT